MYLEQVSRRSQATVYCETIAQAYITDEGEKYKLRIPVPVKSLAILAVEEMYLWPWSSNVWMHLQKLEQCSRSSFLDTDDDGVGKFPRFAFQ